MPPPIPTAVLVIAMMAFLIAIRIAVRDQEETATRDFGLITLYSFISAAGVRLFLFWVI